MNVVYLTDEEARKLKPIFRKLAKEAPWRDARESARRLLQELEMVREDISYEPLSGKQIILESSVDYDFLTDVMQEMELR